MALVNSPPFSLHRHYPASPVLRAPPPPRPARPVPHGCPVGLHAQPPTGLPVLRPIPLSMHADAITPVGPLADVAHLHQEQRPSPKCRRVGPHITLFRGLLSVHSRSGLHARRAAHRRPSTPKASVVSLPPRPLRLLPAGATSCRVGISPTEDQRLCTAHNTLLC